MYNFRTDLALERCEVLRRISQDKEKIDGIELEERKQGDKINISKVKITNKEGEKAIGKPIGTYVTIDIKKLKIAQEEEIEEAANALSSELKSLVDSHIDSNRGCFSCRTWK